MKIEACGMNATGRLYWFELGFKSAMHRESWSNGDEDSPGEIRRGKRGLPHFQLRKGIAQLGALPAERD